MIRTNAAKISTSALLFLLVAAGCGGRRSDSGSAVPVEPISVETVRATPLGGDPPLTLPGRVKAREEVTLSARLSGRLTRLSGEGQSFRSGETLALFDSPETRQAVASARARVADARVQLDVARRQKSRIDSLFATGAVASRQAELARADLQSADAALAGATAALSQWDENSVITAPFAGVVVRRRVDPGSSVMPGQPLLDIRSAEVGEVLVPVPESELAGVEGARFEFQAGDGPWRPAAVAGVDGMTDFQTRNRMVHLKPADPEALLDPGAYVNVRMTGRPDRAGAKAGGPAPAIPAAAVASARLAVPARSLVRRGGLTGVYVVRDGKAWLRWLKIGREDAGQVEVLAGLVPEDVIALPDGPLWDGRPVRSSR